MFPTEVHFIPFSLEVKNSEAMVIVVREMASVMLIPVGVCFCACENVCVRMQSRGSIYTEGGKSH